MIYAILRELRRTNEISRKPEAKIEVNFVGEIDEEEDIWRNKFSEYMKKIEKPDFHKASRFFAINDFEGSPNWFWKK